MISRWDGSNLTICSQDRRGPVVYEFDEILEEVTSPFQKIRVARHRTLGKTLIVGDDVMSNAADTAYDQAMTSLLPNREGLRVLIMGGGDGSLAAMLSGHHKIKSVTSCELDPQVIEVCNRHFPVHLNGFAGRTKTVIGDAFEHIKNHANDYDVIFDDMTVEPNGADEDYRIRIASSFRGKWIISQTGEHGSCLAANVMMSLQSIPADFCRICRHVESFETVWTFTKYKLG